MSRPNQAGEVMDGNTSVSDLDTGPYKKMRNDTKSDTKKSDLAFRN
jgi:hypothetical protein